MTSQWSNSARHDTLQLTGVLPFLLPLAAMHSAVERYLSVSPSVRLFVKLQHSIKVNIIYILFPPGSPVILHCVSKKQNYFCYNYVKLPPNLIILGTKMANSLNLYAVHSFSTSPNSCPCITVLNADVPNCYTTL